MTSQSFTDQEKADIIQGLNTLIKRSRNKITNDELHGRNDFNRVAWRTEKIERAKVLIEKLTVYKTPQNMIDYMLTNAPYETENAPY